MPRIPPQQTVMPAFRTWRNRAQAVFVDARGDDVAVKFRRRIEIVVVGGEAGFLQPLRPDFR